MKPIIGVTSGWEPGHTVEGWPLVYTLKSLIERLEKAGAVPVVLPVVENTDLVGNMVDLLHGLVVSGEVMSISKNVFETNAGNVLETGNPLRYRNEAAALTAALERNMPILAICRGHQMLTAVTGGTVTAFDITENSPLMHQQGGKLPPGEGAHEAVVVQGTKLHEIVGKQEIRVNSFHRQAVETVPRGFRASAVATDGWIEAIEAEDRWIIGTQFHPEMMPDPAWDNLFRSFVERASIYNKG